jgi:hypothetical protein
MAVVMALMRRVIVAVPAPGHDLWLMGAFLVALVSDPGARMHQREVRRDHGT